MTQSRRDFLAQAGLATLGTMLLPKLTFGAAVKPIGIQLWTVKDFMEKDAKGTIEKLSKMGYTAIESYGGDYFKFGPKDFKKLVEDNGMKLLSAHTAPSKNKPTDPTPPDFQKSIDHAQEAGLKYIVMPWINESSIQTEDDCKRTADYFNLFGEASKKAGAQFLYHNHDFEFRKVGDKSIYEHFISNSDPKLVNFEMDIYWVVSGGENPVSLFKKYPNRFPLWHVKDMAKMEKKSTEIGNGRIDFKPIFSCAKLAGLECPVVEQEDYSGSSLDSAKICLVNLKKLQV